MSAFAFTLSAKIRFIAERQVHDAALAGRHRVELIRASSLAHFLGGNSSCGAQLLNPHRPPVLAIETDLLMLPRRQPQHLKREQLKRAQKLATTIKQHRRIGAGEVDENLGLLPIAILRERRIDDDPVLEVEPAVSNDGLKKGIDLLCGGDFVGYGHEISSQLSAVSLQLVGLGFGVLA